MPQFLPLPKLNPFATEKLIKTKGRERVCVCVRERKRRKKRRVREIEYGRESEREKEREREGVPLSFLQPEERAFQLKYFILF